MFSTKLIYAIEFLAELALCPLNRQGRRVLKQREIELRCDMGVTVSRQVVDTLRHNEYIVRLSTGYSLVRELDTITLYELIELFHGGVVIGETLESLFDRTGYRANTAYEKLVQFEDRMRAELTERLRAVNISDLVGAPC